jgi:ribosomal protein L29
MKITKELRGLSREDLLERLGEFKKELLKLNVEVATGANPASSGKFQQTKKNIARIHTLLHEVNNK